ncbi:MAG: hypothetical protein CMM25_00740 [Rhodospirillaceae bacterium]|nr:hypothetical protein [Rhodospirillaceae bacterium]|tara:strand:- start:1810 stop:2571 length:762 start_codon:yes stop_codon:yes gene_type:complete
MQNSQKFAHDKTKSIKVWDVWIRLFHWILVLLIIISYLSATRSDISFTLPGLNKFISAIDIHIFSGTIIAFLIIFRVAWGFIGSSTSLFKDFIFKPTYILQSLKENQKASQHSALGHSPIGGVATLVLLIAIIVQVASGFFSEDDSFFAVQGPLSFLISDDFKHKITVFHALWWQFVIVTLIILHIGANTFYLLVKKNNLIKPLITGYKNLPIDQPFQRPNFAPTWKAVVVFFISSFLIYFIFSLEVLIYYFQ